MSASKLSFAKVIPFRARELLLVDYADQPFVPMKAVVEGMGLSWQGQHAKLTAGRFATTIKEILIVAQDGKQREVTCLPLRKLTGWLMSIHPNKVRPELREGIIAYQDECDDVLWSYWNDGIAVRQHDRNAMTVINELIGMSELSVIKGLIRDKAKAIAADKRQSFALTMHNRLHTRFNVPRTELIPAGQFEAACNFVASYAIEGEYLGPEQAKSQLDIHYPLEALVQRRPEMLEHRGMGQAWLDVSIGDICSRPQDLSLCEKILCELRDAGYEIDGAWFEVRSLRNRLHQLNSFLTGLGNAMQQPTRYAVEVSDGRAAA